MNKKYGEMEVNVEFVHGIFKDEFIQTLTSYYQKQKEGLQKIDLYDVKEKTEGLLHLNLFFEDGKMEEVTQKELVLVLKDTPIFTNKAKYVAFDEEQNLVCIGVHP